MNGSRGHYRTGCGRDSLTRRRRPSGRLCDGNSCTRCLKQQPAAPTTGRPASSLVGDSSIVPASDGSLLRVCVTIWRFVQAVPNGSLGHLPVSFGFLMVPEVVVDPRAHFVGFGVVAWEEANVPVHVS